MNQKTLSKIILILLIGISSGFSLGASVHQTQEKEKAPKINEYLKPQQDFIRREHLASTATNGSDMNMSQVIKRVSQKSNRLARFYLMEDCTVNINL